MNNATPAAPHDDGDVLRFDRPDWMSDEKWAEIKAAALVQLDAMIVALRNERGRS